MRYAASTTLLLIVSGFCTSVTSIEAQTPTPAEPTAAPERLNPPEASAIPKVIKDQATRLAAATKKASDGVKQASSRFLGDGSEDAGSLIDSTWKGNPNAEKAQPSGTDGRYYGTSVSERMLEIRKRAVDEEISRPFLVTEKKVTREVVKDFKGQLPEVPKRTITESVPPASDLMPEPMVENQSAESPVVAESSTVSDSSVASEPPVVSELPVVEASDQGLDDIESRKATAKTIGTQPTSSRPQVVLPTRPIPPTQPAIAAAARLPKPQRLREQPQPRGSEVLLSKRAPSLSFETAGPRTITVGKEASYRISIINTGQVDARNLIVTVSVPPWSEVTGQRATAGNPQLETEPQQKSQIRWDVGSLPADGREHLTVRVIPRQSRPFDLAVGWTFAPGDSLAQIEVQEPLLEMSIDGPPEVLYGDTKTYVITLHNPGTGDAENVVLNLLPITPSQEGAGARRVGILKAGERKQIELELTAQEAGQLDVRAQAYADGGLSAEGSRKVLVRRARLEIAAAGPPMKYAGTPAAYKIRLENTGDAAAEKVFVTAMLPPATHFLSATEGGIYDQESGRVVWRVGTMGARASRLYELQCVLMRGGENQFTIHAQDGGELHMTDTIVTSIEALADLKLYVNDPKGAVPVGSDAAYEVKVVNRGTKAAENVRIKGYFSRGIEPLAVQGWRGEIDKGQVVFDPIGRLNAGQELVFRITARADRSGNHVFRAEVECAAPETRLAAEEWTKYYGDEVPYAGTPVPHQAHGVAFPTPLTPQPSVEFRR